MNYPEKKMKRLNVMIPEYLYDKLQRDVVDKSVTKSFVISSLLFNYYANDVKNEKDSI